jgi:hypothetical protein
MYFIHPAGAQCITADNAGISGSVLALITKPEVQGWLEVIAAPSFSGILQITTF